MDAGRVLDLLARLEAAGVRVWLDGGWGVDALLEAQTRRHDDLDLVAPLGDCEWIEQALRGCGYVLAGGGAPRSFELVDPEGHQVDVHPVSFTAAGDGMYKMENGGDWLYPARGFAGVGRILGQEVPCLTAETMIVCHTTGYALDEAHQRDVIALARRFGIALPGFEAAPRLRERL